MEKLPIKLQLESSFFKREERCGYVVTHEAKLLWAVLLDLMVVFDTVCKKNNIKYFLDSGTLLGAVRHKGFIPWDDDVDVIMFRSEYEKLCKIASTAFESPYFWQTNETDPGSLRRHAQLRNSQTTCILKSEMEGDMLKFGYNQGAFLDVFILDEVPDKEDECRAFLDQLKQEMFMLWDLKNYYWESCENPMFKALQHKAFLEFESIVSRYNGSNQKRVGNISLVPELNSKQFFQKEVFEEVEMCPFEGFMFPIPQNYDLILTSYYGDWRKMVRAETMHSGLFYDMTKPYKNKQRIIHNQDTTKEKIIQSILTHYRYSFAQKFRREKKIRHLRCKVRILAICLGMAIMLLIYILICIIL